MLPNTISICIKIYLIACFIHTWADITSCRIISTSYMLYMTLFYTTIYSNKNVEQYLQQKTANDFGFFLSVVIVGKNRSRKKPHNTDTIPLSVIHLLLQLRTSVGGSVPGTARGEGVVLGVGGVGNWRILLGPSQRIGRWRLGKQQCA